MVVMVPTAATIGIRTSEKINRLKEIFINKANDFAFRSEASLRPKLSVSNAIRENRLLLAAKYFMIDN